MKNIAPMAAVSALAIVSSVSSAEAFSIENRDGEPHVLTIFEGDEQREVRLEPYGRAAELCSSTCGVMVDDGPDSYEVALDDALAIEDGELLDAAAPIDDPAEEPTEEPS